MATDQLLRSDAELASSLRIAVMRLARRLRSTRAETALSLTQLSVLASLERHGPLTPGELAAHEKVQPPSMTKVLADLEALGLVRRDPHPSDGRQRHMSLAAGGAEILREDRRRRDVWLAQRLRGATPQERATLRAAAAILDRWATS